MGKHLSFIVVGFLLGVLATAGVFSITGYKSVVVIFGAEGKDFTAGSAGQSDVERTLRLAHALDQSHPVHKAMVHMAQRLDELSDGAVTIDIFPNGQLGSETETMEMVQDGVLDMTKTSASPMEAFIPRMAVFSLPYVFRDEAHFWKTLNGEIGRELLLLGQDKGLRGVCYYDAGSRNFYTIRTPIMKPDDLNGLKIRVQKSPTSMQMVKTLGGAPTPIPWGELYSSLQQGVVDGAENNLPSYYSNRHFEVARHFSMDEHTRVPDFLLISTRVWDDLPEQAQRWLQQAADESAAYQRKLWAEERELALEKIKADGVQVHHPDKAAFREKVKPMYQQYEGTPVGELIQRISEVE